jgi:hypothetical protein
MFLLCYYANCVHYVNGFDNVGSAYFFYSNPVSLPETYHSTDGLWRYVTLVIAELKPLRDTDLCHQRTFWPYIMQPQILQHSLIPKFSCLLNLHFLLFMWLPNSFPTSPYAQCICILNIKAKGKAIPLQALTGGWGSQILRQSAHEGG